MKRNIDNIADWVAYKFVMEGIDRVFVYPGGTIAPLINACIKFNIKIECFNNEQGSAYAALAYSRIRNKPQVVMVTSGPGVTNVISPLADAYYDSTPLIVITGQIGTADLTTRLEVRQRGFQETPTVDITKPISKKSSCLLTTDDVFSEVPDAFDITVKGRMGPCVLDFPMDVQRTEISSFDLPTRSNSNLEKLSESEEIIIEEGILEAISESKRSVILLGHGSLSLHDSSLLETISKNMDALVVSSFLGLGSFDSSSERFLGYIGHTGHQVANLAIANCDLLLVLGSRLDVRQTGTEVTSFASNAKVISVNNDQKELDNSRVHIDWPINVDVNLFCRGLQKSLEHNKSFSDSSWKSSMENMIEQRLDDIPMKRSNNIQPRDFLDKLAGLISQDETILVTGVGCHQHWAARHLPFKPKTNTFLTSAGHGTMGYDIPSSIGAAMASPEKRIVCIVGDGSALMNIQELAFLKDSDLDIKIIVFNNSRLGIVSQFQLITWGVDPTTGDFRPQDFRSIANGFGINSNKLSEKEDIRAKIEWIWEQKGPALLDVMIDPSADVRPMLLAGQTMDDMWKG
ncbi:MAG: acetolactate synthase [Chloroflexi bacterium]|nr:acetolactate synthase [Chloroflexota bacterium]|tara:strand:- start:404 stop:2122 length:1719 start_codon:yes stop_codon:yes gene_type:complete